MYIMTKHFFDHKWDIVSSSGCHSGGRTIALKKVQMGFTKVLSGMQCFSHEAVLDRLG